MVFASPAALFLKSSLADTGSCTLLCACWTALCRSSHPSLDLRTESVGKSDFQTKYVIPLTQIEEVIFQVILKEKFEEFQGSSTIKIRAISKFPNALC